MEPQPAARPEQPRRPLAPALGTSVNPIVVMESAESDLVRVFESPASPDPSPPTSPVDTPTRRTTPSPPPVSPSRVRCDSVPRYIPLQNHTFELPTCPIPSSPTLNNPSLGMTGEVWPSNPAPRQRRRAPLPPSPRRPRRSAPFPTSSSAPRSPTYAPPPRHLIPSEGSAFNTYPRRAARGRNLFEEFVSSLPRSFPLENSGTPSPPPPVTRSPSPDIMLELYSHTRHPLDLRTHLTILPTWSRKAEKETQGECVICYGTDEHLQIECQRCRTTKVCCHCVVGVYQSINTCPVCRFRGGF